MAKITTRVARSVRYIKTIRIKMPEDATMKPAAAAASNKREGQGSGCQDVVHVSRKPES